MLLRLQNIVHQSVRLTSVFRFGHDTKKLAVKPLLNYGDRLNNRTEITDNVSRRNISPVLDVDDLFAQWHLYKTIERKQLDLKERRKAVRTELKTAQSLERSQQRESSVRRLMLEENVLEEHLNTLEGNRSDVEDKLIDSFLAMPNVIADKTPDQPRVLSSYAGMQTDSDGDSHLEQGNHIEYYSKYSYYLRNDAAQLDTLLPMFGVDLFKAYKFTYFANPEFASSLLIDGALDNSNNQITVHDSTHTVSSNRLHLVGACSIYSFLGFVTRLKVYGTLLPSKWITTGRIYDPLAAGHHGLYDVCQSTGMQVFVAASKDQIPKAFDDSLNGIRQFYDAIGIDYRLVEVPANELKWSACYAVRIELYSPHLRQYVEVGQLIDYSDFLSKRLMFYYEKNKKTKQLDYPHILSGTICNVTRLIAVVLETFNGHVPSHLLSSETFRL